MESGWGTKIMKVIFYLTVSMDSSLVYFSQRHSIRSMEIVVKKFVDLIVTVRIGRWQLIYISLINRTALRRCLCIDAECLSWTYDVETSSSTWYVRFISYFFSMY